MKSTTYIKHLFSDLPASILLMGALAVYLSILVYNAARHDPHVGYDAGGHFENIRAIAQFHLPTREESHEYWSPPLPYVIPALALTSGLTSETGAGKAAQFGNVLLAALMAWLLVRLTRRALPDEPAAPALSILLLAMLPVVYKSFAFVRGEPWLAVLAVAVVLFYGRRFSAGAAFRTRDALIAGGLLGLVALSRQWGFMLFPAVGLFAVVEGLRRKDGWRPIVNATALAFLTAFIVGGWFYLVLWHRYGTPTPFAMNRAETLRLTNQPASFYFDLSLDSLFNDPVRPEFHNRLIPIFYAETWGDYWCYFLIWGRHRDGGAPIAGAGLEPQWYEGDVLPDWMETNRAGMGRYLGRVNTAALLPAGLLLFGLAAGGRRWAAWLAGRDESDEGRIAALAFMAVMFSLAGYFYFLLMFPKHHEGDTIKATYMLQIFPLLALLTGMAMARWRKRQPELLWGTVALLILVFLHNIPACVSRWTF